MAHTSRKQFDAFIVRVETTAGGRFVRGLMFFATTFAVSVGGNLVASLWIGSPTQSGGFTGVGKHWILLAVIAVLTIAVAAMEAFLYADTAGRLEFSKFADDITSKLVSGNRADFLSPDQLEEARQTINQKSGPANGG